MSRMSDDTDGDRRPIYRYYMLGFVGVIGAVPWTGWPGYLAGMANAEGASVRGLVAMIGALLLLIVTILLCVALGTTRQQRRAHAGIALAGVLVWCAILYGFSVLHRPSYEGGFHRWVYDNVHREPILAWHAAMTTNTALSTTTTVPAVHVGDPPNPGECRPSEWPPEILALAPRRVTRLPNGVMLEWGAFGTWGSARRVFVGIDDVDPTPTDPNRMYPFRRLGAGLWAGFQLGG